MKVRTLTAIIALLIFLPILLMGGTTLMLFAYLLALIALKELLNMNMIKLISVPGIFSALALIIIMLPQSAGDWVSNIQLKSLIAMSFILLSYTVLSKTDLVLWMLLSVLCQLHMSVLIYVFLCNTFRWLTLHTLCILSGVVNRYRCLYFRSTNG